MIGETKEQRDNAASAADTGPDRHVFGRLGISRQTASPFVTPLARAEWATIQQGMKARCLGSGQTCRRIAEPFRQFLNRHREGARGVAGDRRRHFERA